MSKQYADRDPQALEPWYSRHVGAMTAEGLHGKAHIAAELAYRDKRITELENAIDKGLDLLEEHRPNDAVELLSRHLVFIQD